jgi:hypothetical protein
VLRIKGAADVLRVKPTAEEDDNDEERKGGLISWFDSLNVSIPRLTLAAVREKVNDTPEAEVEECALDKDR